MDLVVFDVLVPIGTRFPRWGCHSSLPSLVARGLRILQNFAGFRRIEWHTLLIFGELFMTLNQ
jgi:hypothetical protein